MSVDVAIVTGASGGIGSAVARLIHGKAGDQLRVALQYHRGRQAAEALAAELPGSLAVQADLSTAAGREALVRASLELGTPFILVNVAGVDKPHEPALAIEEASFEAFVDLNLKAPLFLMKAFGSEMARAGSGVIVNVSSVLARKSMIGSAVYRATKAALEALTLQFARELGPRGVRVNAVAPGFIETEMTRGMTEEAREAARREIPSGALGSPQAVAEAIGQLIENEYINGAVLAVDGGLSS